MAIAPKAKTVTKIVALRSIKRVSLARHVGRRHPTTNQRNIKMFELMMKVVNHRPQQMYL